MSELAFTIRPLAAGDAGYALSSWREGNKASPKNDRVPWSYYRATVGVDMARVINDPSTKLLGAYAGATLLGWLAFTPGKRVHTLHWAHVKFQLENERLRRRGIMTALLAAAELGKRFIYTCQARRDRKKLEDGSMTKSLDESLAQHLRGTGVTAVYEPLKEWLK